VTALGANACKQSCNGCQQLLQAAQHIKRGHVVLVKCYVNTEHFEQELTLRDLPEVRRRLTQAVAVFSKNDSEAVSACDTGLSPFIIFSASMVGFPVSFVDELLKIVQQVHAVAEKRDQARCRLSLQASVTRTVYLVECNTCSHAIAAQNNSSMILFCPRLD
jgi:hypothetical protein